VATLVEETGARLRFVHVSAGEASDVLRYSAREGGLRNETCHALPGPSPPSCMRRTRQGTSAAAALQLWRQTPGTLWNLIEDGAVSGQQRSLRICSGQKVLPGRLHEDPEQPPGRGAKERHPVLKGSGRLTHPQGLNRLPQRMGCSTSARPKGRWRSAQGADLVLVDPNGNWTLRSPRRTCRPTTEIRSRESFR